MSRDDDGPDSPWPPGVSRQPARPVRVGRHGRPGAPDSPQPPDHETAYGAPSGARPGYGAASYDPSGGLPDDPSTPSVLY
ncbi:MAG: hypothetical protein ACRDNZ_00115, partial [Streptosporangiaceae bacterium]